MKWIDVPWGKEKTDKAFKSIIKKNTDEVADYLLWVIKSKQTESSVGVIGLSKLDSDNNKRDIGIMLLPSFQGKGGAVEIMITILDYAFKDLSLEQITCKIHKKHIACIRLAEKLGFKIRNYHEDWILWEKSYE